MTDLGLSNDNTNGRHRNLREALSEIQNRLNHVGLNDDDRAFITAIISNPKISINFEESIEKKDFRISRLSQDVLDLTRESQERAEIIAIRDRDIEEKNAAIAEASAGWRSARQEIARLQNALNIEPAPPTVEPEQPIVEPEPPIVESNNQSETLEN